MGWEDGQGQTKVRNTVQAETRDPFRAVKGPGWAGGGDAVPAVSEQPHRDGRGAAARRRRHLPSRRTRQPLVRPELRAGDNVRSASRLVVLYQSTPPSLLLSLIHAQTETHKLNLVPPFLVHLSQLFLLALLLLFLAFRLLLLAFHLLAFLIVPINQVIFFIITQTFRGGTISFRAMRDVRRGEEITIGYVDLAGPAAEVPAPDPVYWNAVRSIKTRAGARCEWC